MTRTMTSLSLLFALLAALLTPAVAAAQSIRLETGATEGRVLQYEVDRSIAVTQRAGDGAESQTSVRYQALLETRVTGASDDGATQVTARVLRYAVRHEDPEGATSLAFAADEASPAPAEGLLAFTSVLERTKLVYDVTAAGRVANLAGLEPVGVFIAGAGAEAPQLFEFFEPRALAELLTLLTHAEGGIGAHAIGEEWEINRRVPFGPAGAFDLKTTSAIRLAQGPFAAIGSVTEFSLMAPRERDAATPVVTLGKSDGQTLITWDTADGGLMEHSSAESLITNWTLGEITLRQEQRSKTRVARAED